MAGVTSILDVTERLIDALLSEGLWPDDDSSEDYTRAFEDAQEWVRSRRLEHRITD